MSVQVWILAYNGTQQVMYRVTRHTAFLRLEHVTRGRIFMKQIMSVILSILLCMTLSQGIYASAEYAEVPSAVVLDEAVSADDPVEEDLSYAEEATAEEDETEAVNPTIIEENEQEIIGPDDLEYGNLDDETLVGASQGYPFTVIYGQTEARSMLAMVNSFRTGSDAWYWSEDNSTKVQCSGLSQLTYDYKLEKVAMLRAAELAVSYSHTRPNGGNSGTAYNELGYSWSWRGENIAAGYRNAEAVFVGWREDDEDYDGQGHRRNMLNSNFNRIGIAHITYNGTQYWVQEFAKSTESVSSTAANDSATKVNISISDEWIKGKTVNVTPTSISLNEKASAALPEAEVILDVDGHWYYGAAAKPDITAAWTMNNSSIASVSDDKITGVSAGNTYLSTTIYGENVTIPVAVNHVPVTDPAVAATCAKTGLTEGSHCSVCGTVIKAQQTVAKKAHTVVKDPAVAATCAKTGLTEGSHCSVCGTVIKAQQTVAKKAHTVVKDPAVAATCTGTGLTEGSHCSVCKTVIKAQQEVAALGHSWGEWVVTKEATYESAGEKQRVCSHDSSHVDTQVIPMLTKSGFSDVQDPNHAFYKAIYWAADAGITKGYPDGTFGIDRSCTRGEMIMFLWRYAGKPAAKAVTKSPFSDVPKTHAFYNAILWGSQEGITKGYPDGTFGINRNVSRGECMMFLWRLRGKPAPKAVSVSPFKDVPKNHAFYNAILWGAQKKITNGYTSGPKKGTFGINENCTRGAIVTFLYRAR